MTPVRTARAVSSSGDLFPRGEGLSGAKRQLSKEEGPRGPKKRRRRVGLKDEDHHPKQHRHGIQWGRGGVRRLSRKRLRPGVSVLAVVRWVRGGQVGVALPGNMLGVAELDEEGQEASKVRLGMIAAVIVSDDDDKKERKEVKVELGLKMVNRGWLGVEAFGVNRIVIGKVESVEDHGCVVGFGGGNFRGFWRFEKETDVADEWKVGQLVVGGVKKVRGNVVQIGRGCGLIKKDRGFEELRVGLLVEGLVERTEQGKGAVLRVWGTVLIEVEEIHVPEGWREGKEVGDSGAVRVIWLDPMEKRVGGSLLPGLVKEGEDMAVPARYNKVGDLVKDSKVEKVEEPHIGLLLKGERGLVWVPANRILDDGQPRNLAKKFSPGDEMESVRIAGWSDFDGIAIGDMRQSQLLRNIWSWADVKVGSVYDCRIVGRSKNGGLKVSFEENRGLKGIVPLEEILDYEVTERRISEDQRFKIGNVLSCRVIRLDEEKNRARLNSQPRIVRSKYPVLISYAQAASMLSSVVVGVVVATTEGLGVVVRFCNNVVGYIPGSDIGNVRDKADLAARFPRGLPVKTRIVYVNQKETKCTLSLDVDSDAGRTFQANLLRFDKGSSEASSLLTVGSMVTGVVTGIAAGPERTESDTISGAELRSSLGFSNQRTPCYLGEQLSGCYLKVAVLLKYTTTKLSTREEKDGKRKKSNTTPGHVCLHNAKPPSDKKRNITCTDETPCPHCIVCANCVGNTVKCILPAMHLSDSAELCSKLFAMYGAKLGEAEMTLALPDVALVLSSKMTEKSLPRLTLKRSLINAYKDRLLPQSSSSLPSPTADFTRSPLRGYVVSAETSGCVIAFGNYAGYCSKSLISDNYVRDATQLVGPGMSVACAVHEILEDGRCKLSMRKSEVGSKWMSDDLVGVLEQLAWIQKSIFGKETESNMPVGSLVKATEPETRTYGLALTLENQSGFKATGVVLPTSASDILKKLNEKPSLDVAVVDVDAFTGVVDVIAPPQQSLSRFLSTVALPTNICTTATVILIKSMYVVLMLEHEEGSYIVYSPPVRRLKPAPGTKLKCTTKEFVAGRNVVFVNEDPEGIFQQRRRSTHPVDEVGKSLKLPGKGDWKINRSFDIGSRVVGHVTKVGNFDAMIFLKKNVLGRLHIVNSIEPKKDTHGVAESLPPGPKALETLDPRAFPLGTVESLHARLPTKGSKVSLVVMSSTQKEGRTFLELRSPSIGSVTVSEDKQIGVVISADPRKGVIVCTGTDQRYVVNKSNRIGVDAKAGDVVVVTKKLIKSSSNESDSLRLVISENGRQNSQETRPFDAVIGSHSAGKGIKIFLPVLAGFGEIGWIPITEISDDFDCIQDIAKRINKVIRVVALEGRGDVVFSSRASRIAVGRTGELEVKVTDPVINQVQELKKGQSVRGIVRAVSKRGLFVSLGEQVVAKVLLCNLADEFVQSPEKRFPPGTIVNGKIVKAVSDPGKLELTMRKRPRARITEPKIEEPLQVGSIVKGTVEKVERYGAYIKLDGISSTALLHISQVSDEKFVQDMTKECFVGTGVTCVVTSVKEDGKKLGLSTKRSSFLATEQFSTEQITSILEANRARLAPGPKAAQQSSVIESNDRDMMEDVEGDKGHLRGREGTDISVQDHRSTSKAGRDHDTSSESVEVGSDLVVDTESDDSREEKEAVAPLKISAEFNFVAPDAKSNPAVTGSSDPDQPFEENEAALNVDNVTVGEDAIAVSSGKAKTNQKQTAFASIEKLRKREEELASNTAPAETPADFERLLMGNPNSSILWLRYMALHLSLGEVDSARSVAERALSRISHREEIDRFNVWIGYVNLEACYGSHSEQGRHAAVFRILDRAAVRVTNPERLYLQIASNLCKRPETERIAEEVSNRSLKMFKHSEHVWIAAGTSIFAKGQLEEGRKLLQKALLSIGKDKHAYVIMKFAQLEYRYGSVERARTVFERLIGSSPKRLDLWNVYLDMELGQCTKMIDEGDEERAVAISSCRRLFERCLSQELSSKKTKFVFKRWLKFEQEFGDKRSITNVKDKARAYVQSKIS